MNMIMSMLSTCLFVFYLFLASFRYQICRLEYLIFYFQIYLFCINIELYIA